MLKRNVQTDDVWLHFALFFTLLVVQIYAASKRSFNDAFIGNSDFTIMPLQVHRVTMVLHWEKAVGRGQPITEPIDKKGHWKESHSSQEPPYM